MINLDRRGGTRIEIGLAPVEKRGKGMADIQILVVEDEGIVARDIENTLTRLGYAVCDSASSGREAIIKAEARQPDLVLMDMDIVVEGKVAGVQAAGEIHDRLDIPVVYLSAYSDN
ncbi:MAG: response regulator, partial [Deltaproteobacteria bacterium]|nr:response regulator [Deltaproteobacteria bacterium]